VAQEPVRLKYPSFLPKGPELPAKPGLSPAEPCFGNDGRKLDLKVIFTDLCKTAAALSTARAMARGLGARITLIVAQVVPYPLPLAAPDVPVEFTERLLESITSDQDAGDCDDAETTVEVYLCRDRCETIRRALPADSIVIVGARKWPWWPSCWPSWLPQRDRQLTRMLRCGGWRVVVVTV